MARHDDVYGWAGDTPDVSFGEYSFRLPLAYHDNDVFTSLHTASYATAKEALPSPVIEPARWVDGRALVSVTAFRYRAITFANADGSTGSLVPYGEIAIGIVVTRGPVPRLLPVLQRRMWMFVLHLPVTTVEARDGGVALWGYPKFVADMDFTERPGERAVTLSEGGATILTSTVRPSGPVLPFHVPPRTYTVRDRRLLETVVPTSGHVQTRLGRHAGALELGDHPVARGLAGLDISPAPVAVYNFLSHRSLLPAGRDIGPAEEYRGFTAPEREFGRYTMRYPGAPALDLYAPPVTVARLSGDLGMPARR
jgi:hypothetical protein